MKKEDKIQTLESEIKALEEQQYELQEKIASKRRYLNRVMHGPCNRIVFGVQCFVDGVIQGRRVEFERGFQITEPPFEWFLTYCMIIESLNKSSGTHLDFVIGKYAKAFGISKDEEERLMQKYWHKKSDTIAGIVKEWSEGEREIYQTEEIFIAELMSGALRRFESAPLEIKYGVLYYIFKYHEKGDFDELSADIERVPQKVRELIDGWLLPKEKTHDQT